MTMGFGIGVAVLLLVLAGLLVRAGVLGARDAGAGVLPYERREALLTPAERSFLGVLEQAIGTRARVFAQVRLADVLTVAPGKSRTRLGALNRISAKHLDFVLCHPQSLAILGALELDDTSHRRRDRQRRDTFVDQACQAAGLPLVRVPARATYTVQDVRNLLAEMLAGTPAPAVSTAPSAPAAASATTPAAQPPPPAPPATASRCCAPSARDHAPGRNCGAAPTTRPAAASCRRRADHSRTLP